MRLRVICDRIGHVCNLFTIFLVAAVGLNARDMSSHRKTSVEILVYSCIMLVSVSVLHVVVV
jgi:hypothetical protein